MVMQVGFCLISKSSFLRYLSLADHSVLLVTPDPWNDMVEITDQVVALLELSRSRCLVHSPGDPVWYLGERVSPLHLVPVREGFTTPNLPPRSMLSQALGYEELAHVEDDINRLTSMTLERFEVDIPYETHLESLAALPRLDLAYVSIAFCSSFPCFVVFCSILITCHLRRELPAIWREPLSYTHHEGGERE